MYSNVYCIINILPKDQATCIQRFFFFLDILWIYQDLAQVQNLHYLAFQVQMHFWCDLQNLSKALRLNPIGTHFDELWNLTYIWINKYLDWNKEKLFIDIYQSSTVICSQKYKRVEGEWKYMTGTQWQSAEVQKRLGCDWPLTLSFRALQLIAT